jgi:hypothetical protein
MRTDFETLKSLSTFTLNHLSQSEIIEYEIENRSKLIEALATELNVSFSTEEDIRDQAIEEVEDKFGQDNVPEDITETEMFNHARKEIIKSYNGENLAGLYMYESLHKVAVRVKNFLLENDLVEEVYSTDAELIAFLVSKMRGFTHQRKPMEQQQH